MNTSDRRKRFKTAPLCEKRTIYKRETLLLYWKWLRFPVLAGGIVLLKNSISESVRVLQDRTENGQERPWRERKQQSRDLAAYYIALGGEFVSKAERVAACATWLDFVSCPEGHEKRLRAAMFCQVRLCPVCSWRRSLKIYAQLNRVLHEAVKRKKMRFVFLTLTTRNVEGKDLVKTIDHLFKSWQRLTQRKVVRDAVIGWFRVLEITRNPLRKDYHPHFHALLAVSPGYFKGRGYIKQAEWVELWREAMRVDYRPVVDVRVVKPKREGQTVEAAVAESGKYAVKPTDWLLSDPDEACEVVETFDVALRNRRLVGYGGLFREIRRELQMPDPESENADLIDIDEDGVSEDCRCSICQSGMMREMYKWHIGFRDYVLVEEGE